MKQDIRPQELAARIQAGEHFHIVDVRTAAEYASGHIPGSSNAPLDQIGPNIPGVGASENLVIVCRSGVGSLYACNQVAERHPNLLNLVGGVAGWRRAGLDVVRPPKATRSLDRQTHLVAGLLLVTAFFLAEFVGSSWIYLAALPAFGLLLDALTGICPMTLLLKRMPWNAVR